MEKYIFDIGRTKYKINTDAFAVLIEEGHREIERTFDEVMQLYREYARTGSADVLVSLKCRLEEVSSMYGSVALAEEVLHINSCLPYERRVPCDRSVDDFEELRLRH